MSDDDRKRRRLGDETKGRIADLASGWDSPSEAGPTPAAGRPASPPANAPRRKQQKTMPPPPPGAGRKQIDDALFELEAEAEAQSVASGEPSFDVDIDVDDEGGEGAGADADHADGADGDAPGDDENWELPTMTNPAPARPRRPAAARPARAESSSVDVSGIIPDAPQPPELSMPAPTVDASALSGGAPRRAGTRTTPPPPPGARATGAAPLAAPRSPTAAAPAVPRGPTGAYAAAASGPAAAPRNPTGAAPAAPRSPTGAYAAAASGPLAASGPAAPPRRSPTGAYAAAAAASAVGAEPPARATGAAPTAPPRRSPTGAYAAAAAASAIGEPPARPTPGRATRAPIAEDSAPGGAADPSRSGGSRSVPVGEFDNALTSVQPDKLRVAYEQATVVRETPSELLGRSDTAPAAKSPPPPPGAKPKPPAPAPAASDDDSGVLVTPASGDPDAIVDFSRMMALQEPPGRGDPTAIEPETLKYEPETRKFDRDRAGRGRAPAPDADESGIVVDSDRPGADATEIRPPGSATATTPRARLRTIAQLRRRRGVGGDMRYVLTAIFGLRRVRRELAALEAQQTTRLQSRRRHLVTLGRTAVLADGFEHHALDRASQQLLTVEEERTRAASQVSAAEADQKRATREREEKAKQLATNLAEIDTELADLGKQLEPLEKEMSSVSRRAADLRDAMRRIDEKIAFTEAKLSAADLEPDQAGAIQAEIASLKADRKELQKDEPELASALDSLHPRIAKLEAGRADARRRRTDLEEAEQLDQRRTEEVLAAIGARRKVVDRALSDTETARDKILFEFGERLYVDRPESMAPELSPIDAIDVELGTGDRRMMELREILGSVDRWKIVRGVGLWILLLAAAGAIAAVALGLLPLPF